MSDHKIKPVAFGCSGTDLTEEERRLFAEGQPFGLILFQRNCLSPEQVKKLIADFRKTVGRFDAPVFIDQEGGRVARLKPPRWPALPALRAVGELYEKNPARGLDAVRLHAQITAHELYSLGISVNFAPVLDLFIEGASSAIGDRAISNNPDVVANVARAMIETYMNNGILPVIKHMPGHGRVKVDPHEVLPFVDEAYATLSSQDFEPFRKLRDAPLGMNCHVVFKALDPVNPVSLSQRVNNEIIRKALDFDGLLFSDDIAMKALEGNRGELAAKALAAGADVVVHCSGDINEMRQILAALPEISPIASKRWKSALSRLKPPKPGYYPESDLRRLRAMFNG